MSFLFCLCIIFTSHCYNCYIHFNLLNCIVYVSFVYSSPMHNVRHNVDKHFLKQNLSIVQCDNKSFRNKIIKCKIVNIMDLMLI